MNASVLSSYTITVCSIQYTGQEITYFEIYLCLLVQLAAIIQLQSTLIRLLLWFSLYGSDKVYYECVQYVNFSHTKLSSDSDQILHSGLLASLKSSGT